ncbi:sensor domain-containing protein [Baekduia sp. Peel2402]|uniref:sensor domain-containing protein n=1 Tax=Baekduia sp. Peel2402 TaxID=3458296 RepID=UPI00403EC074
MDPVRAPEHDSGQLHAAQTRFRIAFEEAGVGMAIIGLDGKLHKVNRELAALLRTSEDALLAGRGMVDVSHPDDVAARSDDFARLSAGETDRYKRDRRYLRGDGTTLWGATTISLVRDADGTPLYAIGQLEDITARRAAEEAVRRRAAQQTALARLSQRAITEQDFDALARATVTTITEELGVSLVGLAALESDGSGLVLVSGTGAGLAGPGDVITAPLDGRHAMHTVAQLGPVVVDDTASETRFDVRDLVAAGIASSVTVPVAGEGDALYGVLGIHSTEQRAFDSDDLAFLQSVANVLTGALRRLAAERSVRHQALHDPLTQLPNRALLLDRLRLALARHRRRAEGWVAMLYVDLDDFKGVNDSLGHGAGDTLLRSLAPRLSEALRPSDTLARLGGDEFAVLCEGLDEVTESVAIAERLLEVVSMPVDVAGVELRPTASIGIALAGPGVLLDGEDLVRDGGVAMYRAKRSGRGHYEIFDDHMRAETVERVALTNDLRRAIDEGGLRLVYQPMVRFEERRATSFEALVRWTHPERGEIPPGRFIPLAEQHGLIEPLGRWVLNEALDQLRRWRDAGLALGDMSMSVNVSRVQLSRPGLAEQVFAALDERDLAAEQLVLEVTESAVMDDPDVANATLDALTAGGVRIALDDFGVGQSSLACLRDLPLDVLKLDRGFITSLASSRQAAAIVRAVCDMARTLGFTIVAEGVETEMQAQVVESLGCDVGQGFLYSHGVRPEEVPDAVETLDFRLTTASTARLTAEVPY